MAGAAHTVPACSLQLEIASETRYYLTPLEHRAVHNTLMVLLTSMSDLCCTSFAASGLGLT